MEPKILHKIGIKPGQRIISINAPAEYDAVVRAAGLKSAKQLRGKFDHIHLFAKSKSEIDKYAEKLVGSLNPEGALWIAYPKKSSKIETDLSRDNGWETFGKLGYRAISLISLDETWSSLRMKPTEAVSEKYRKEQSSDEFKKYIDTENRAVKAPEDLASELKKQPNLKKYFEALAYSHKKEYVQWILGAKKEETRSRRVSKTIEMLSAGKKNPNEK